MKKNLIGIIAIGVLGCLVASGCTYSRGKMQTVDASGEIESPSQQDEGSGSDQGIVPTGEVAEGDGDIVVPTGGTVETGNPPSGEDSENAAAAPSGGSFVAGGWQAEATKKDSEDQTPLAVKSAVLLSGHRIIAVTFTKPVDVQAVIQNQSIAFFVSPVLFPIPLKGILFAGLFSSPAFSETVYFALDKSEKEVHIHDNGSGWVLAPYTLKVYGLDSSDPSKAVEDQSGEAMANEYEHTFLCGTDPDSAQVTYVDDCLIL